MEGNINSLKKQIDLLYREYQDTSAIKQREVILMSLIACLDLYSYITGEECITIQQIKKVNPYSFNKILERKHQKENIFLKNFIENQSFHFDFIMELVTNTSDIYELSLEEIDKAIPFPYIEADKIINLLYYYFDNCYKKGKELFEKLYIERKIFTFKNQISTRTGAMEGETIYDMFNNQAFMTITSSYGRIENVATIIHELAHIEDFQEINKNDPSALYKYLLLSSYQEVAAYYREADFYRFLIENNIYKEEAKNTLLREYQTCYETFYGLLLLTKLPSKYLKNDKFTHLKQKQINKIFDIDEEQEGYDDEGLVQSLGLDFNIKYSYGPILGVYFAENKELYNRFKEERMNLFNRDLLKELNITSERVAKIYQKR